MLRTFKKAIKLNPEFGYAIANLGYALIQLGQLEEGKNYLDKALTSSLVDMAYINRNFALYFSRKNEFELAESYFQKAFEVAGSPVDMLEIHYAEFLTKQGKLDEAQVYIVLSIEKGDFHDPNKQ